MVVADVTPVLTQTFPSKATTFLTCFCRGERGENTLEKTVASTGDQTHNHQVMSPTSSPLSHPGRALSVSKENIKFLSLRIFTEEKKDSQSSICIRIQCSSYNSVRFEFGPVKLLYGKEYILSVL